MIQYVLCITRNSAGNFIMLEKKRPKWQAGRLNFPGGKVEQCETIKQATVRECGEELGVATCEELWRHIANLEGEDYTVFVLTYAYSILTARTSSDESVKFIPLPEIFGLPTEFIENCGWLAALSLDNESKFVTVAYGGNLQESPMQELKRKVSSLETQLTSARIHLNNPELDRHGLNQQISWLTSQNEKLTQELAKANDTIDKVNQLATNALKQFETS
jgi:8-oxo-dGTP pyrophosphatase MutT (NUDIX family)